MDEHPRVTDAGEVPIPGAGNVRVAGLTPAAAANLVHDRLIAAHYMNHPQVVVTVDQYATQSVSVLGEVKLSGAYPIGTGRSILDVLALAGGLTPDADRNILIERRADPGNPIHYNVSNDAGKAIAEQVTVYPGDTIVVPKAGIVYILGDVNRPGGYVMTNNESQMTVLQAVAMAGGLTRAAKQGHARLIRKEAGGGYSDRELPIGKMQEGKLADIAMLPEDIVYIPFSYAKNIATSGAAGIVASAASASIYQLP
jgi:polysaccharide export outer membrane protein